MCDVVDPKNMFRSTCNDNITVDESQKCSGFMNVIFLHSRPNHRYVSATYMVIFRVKRTRISIRLKLVEVTPLLQI
jgi:hypothetical protein